MHHSDWWQILSRTFVTLRNTLQTSWCLTSSFPAHLPWKSSVCWRFRCLNVRIVLILTACLCALIMAVRVGPRPPAQTESFRDRCGSQHLVLCGRWFSASYFDLPSSQKICRTQSNVRKEKLQPVTGGLIVAWSRWCGVPHPIKNVEIHCASKTLFSR